MLHIPLETLAWIIVKAREVNVKDVDSTDLGDAGDEDDGAVLEDRGDDPSAEELTSWVEDLTETGQAELVALFWTGRGDVEPEEWAETVAEARDLKEGSTAAYLLRHPLLADMLEEGLEKIGMDVSEIEGMI